ncbi:MAG: hypothetical protein K2J61_03730 [Clostridia bacterium]|nr:hypothetical protein [Clostridia bacterium]MDE7400545.1 hypothetical protein [Clostridia bacterium]
MSFFSNFQSDKCPGTINGNPLNGMCEKVCIQAQKIFDACIKQVQLENYTLTVSSFTPANPTYPLTFISMRSTNAGATLTNVSVDRLADKQDCARVQATVNIPVEVVYTDANGAEGIATATISVSEDVLLFVPAPSIMPYKVVAEASAVSAEGTFNSEAGTFTVNSCVSIILKIAIDVEILVPSYGYCAIPPAQDYSKEVCAGFFELPLYPQGRSCNCK